VQQSGKNLRATIQLTEVKTNHTLWAERYERVVEDVFNLQDDITREVVSALNIELLVNEILVNERYGCGLANF
jgi:TolB-like protein